jgi:hypothetical protein
MNNDGEAKDGIEVDGEIGGCICEIEDRAGVDGIG